MPRVILAMSGGVDSSVAAHLLLEQGYDVIGVFMRHGHQSPVACEATNRLDRKQGCCTAADAEDARRVADRLDIPFYAINLEAEFNRVVNYFIEEYTAGRTPNPCIVCNHWIKFGKLFDYADGVGAPFVATGHYARLTPGGDGRPSLRRGHDVGKDQSYVLFGIDRGLLPRMLLPNGEFDKRTIREIAAGLGLHVAGKPDSQEICFVTEGRYDAFVRAQRQASNRLGPADRAIDTAGEIVTTDGTVVGRHPGIEGFTIGQRKGLGVALGAPRYVVRIERDSRRVVLGERHELSRDGLTASGVNWLVDPPVQPLPCLAKIRYAAPAVPATCTAIQGERLRIDFDQPQSGVAPGQAVVCYEDDRVLGGGWIE